MILLLLIICIVAFGILVILFTVAWVMGYYEVKVEERQPMFFCEKKHGPISEKSVIEFVGVKSCGLCFHEKMSLAEKGKLK